MREIKFRAWDKYECKMYNSKDLVIYLEDFSKSIYVHDYKTNKLKTLYDYELQFILENVEPIDVNEEE